MPCRRSTHSASARPTWSAPDSAGRSRNRSPSRTPDRVATLTLVDAAASPAAAPATSVRPPLVLHDENSRPVSAGPGGADSAAHRRRLGRAGRSPGPASYRHGSPTAGSISSMRRPRPVGHHAVESHRAASAARRWVRRPRTDRCRAARHRGRLRARRGRRIPVPAGFRHHRVRHLRRRYPAGAGPVPGQHRRLSPGRSATPAGRVAQAPSTWSWTCSPCRRLPDPPRPTAIAAVASLVAPGGRLVAVAAARDDGHRCDGPPWPLTRAEITSYATDGLVVSRISQVRTRARTTPHAGWLSSHDRSMSSNVP